MENIENINQKVKKPIIILILNIFFILCILSIFIYHFCFPPVDSKIAKIHISDKDNLSSIALNLKIKKVIKNEFVFKSLVFVFNGEKNIKIGDYFFEEKKTVFSVAWQVARGHHNIEKIKITFPEGIKKEEMALILAEKLAHFRKDLFMTDERAKEGYLFPDTYFFFEMSTTDEVLDEISKNFKNKISKVQDKIDNSGKTLNEIITMASIIEGEARGENDASLISGILWKRIDKNMPLQVDVDRGTYKKLGLPDNPIANPGMISILASLKPTSSDYLYYLHDKNGNIHFAKDYKEHKKNINIYLK